MSEDTNKMNMDDVDVVTSEDTVLTREQMLELREALIVRRAEVVKEYERHVREASEDTGQLPDEIDVAERQSRHAYLFRLADKESKLLREIDRALSKFSRGNYGICEGTGDAIGLRRLKSRPWTRYSLEHKELLERRENKSRTR